MRYKQNASVEKIEAKQTEVCKEQTKACDTPDMVNHPSHYNQGKIEVIDFIEDQKFDFHTGTAIRYICRAGHKWNEIEDLEKAIWYINRRIMNLRERKTSASGEVANV